jgi:cardiolipin synthase
MNIATQLILIFYLVISLWSAGHALLYKRDSRSSLVWIILSIILPFIGPISYYLFGINRIERIAKKLSHVSLKDSKLNKKKRTDYPLKIASEYQSFIQITDGIETRELLFGNSVSLLRNGEGAYPVILQAINQANSLIVVSTYIFDNDTIGNKFADALTQAKSRGVDVFVLIDGIGALYSFPSIVNKLKRNGINCEKFLPIKLFPPSISINLRNHRKIIVIDQHIGFTGGINISDRHQSINGETRHVSDMHFMFKGSIVQQLYDLFCKDWFTVTGKNLHKLKRQIIKPSINESTKGHIPCRVISDGPDEDLNKLSLILHSAICAANHTVTIMTPYFIPSRQMVAIILAAANRGITINIILPEKSNLPYVDAATRNLLWELLEWDIKVFYQPPPFEHGKVIIIDNRYVLIGSANIDPRSLRLNYELMVEILNQEFAQKMNSELQYIIQKSRQVSYQEVESRSFLVRIKDSLAWLFSPYL